MIRTPKQAIAFVKRQKVVPMTPSGDLPSFVVAVAGGPVKGSWWGHPKGALIYDLAKRSSILLKSAPSASSTARIRSSTARSGRRSTAW